MKKILFILALLLELPGSLWADSFTRVDCGTLTGVAIGDDCLQTSNVNGRLAGRTYAYNGSAWIEKAAPSIVNAQTGTTYTFLNSDSRKLVTFTNGSAIAVTLPQAGASSAFMSGWFVDVQNRGAGTATITPTTSTIDGAASVALTLNQGIRIFSDGTNYFTMRGGGAAGGGSGDALTTNSLSQFAATTSAQLATVISNETGSGALVFGTSPTLVTPALGTPASGVATNLTGLNATQLTAGTVPDARFPATLPAASGVNLTALNASNLASGETAIARVTAALKTKSITFRVGSDQGSALADTDDEATVWRNNIAPMTISEVWCESNAGTPTFNLGKDDGSLANILSSDLTCTTSGATTTTFVSTQNVLALGDKIDFLMGTAGGVAARMTISIQAALNP